MILNCYGQTWQVLDSLAYLYSDTKPDSAIALSQKALELCSNDKKSADYATCLSTLAYAFYKKGNKKTADSIFKNSLTIFESDTKNKTTNAYTKALNLYGIFNETLLNYKISEQLYTKAISIRINELKQDSVECSDLFNNLGSLMRRTGNLTQAEYYQWISNRLYKKRLKHDQSPTLLRSYYNNLKNLSKIYEDKGDFRKAEEVYMELLNNVASYYPKDDGNLLYANTLNDIGVFYGKAGRIETAENYFDQSRTIIKKIRGETSQDYGRVLNNIATLYTYHKTKLDQAEILLKEVDRIHSLQGSSKETNMEYLSLKNNLGMLYLEQRNYEKAEKEFLNLIPLLGKKLGQNSAPYAATLNNLAGVYENMNKLGVAESLYKESIKVKEKIYGESSVQVGHTIANIAKVYFLKKDYVQSDSMYQKSLSVLKKQYPPYHVDILTRIFDLTNLYIYVGDIQRADKRLSEAKSIVRQYYSNKHSKFYDLMLFKAISALYYKQHKFDSAIYYIKKSVEYLYEDLETTFNTLSEEEKIKYNERYAYNTLNQFYFYLLSLSSEQKKDYQENLKYAYEMSITNKGFILTSLIDIRKKIFNSEDTALKKMYYQWKELKDKYVKVAGLSNQDLAKNKINLDSMLFVINNLEKEMAYKSEVFSKTKRITREKYYDAVVQHLRKSDAAIEIVRVICKDNLVAEKDSIVYIALIAKGNMKYPEMVILPYGNQLENQYYINFKRSIQNKTLDDISYKVFWKSIAERLKGIKSVYFSPDGIYHQINIATLYNPETKKYVFDEIQVINVTNTKDILNKRTYTTKNNYLIGNPKFDLQIGIEKDNEKSKQERTFEGFLEGLSQLEGAEKEVKQISSILPNSTVIVGANATEEYIKSLKNPRILHIATHGYFKKGQYQSSTQAMLNAGLLLAGVVDYDRIEMRPLDKEDGKLTAFEVMNMELDSTELVVLSACETGLGQVGKEGVYGLQRAFKVAGSQSIIMSLWKVNDEATQLLMTKFYENWQKKSMPKRKAFEAAQKETRKQYKEPYYWGAFVMIE
ncbi:MAG: CHAT domain-containing protein [Bacteroidia bacterium]|nr:CHAT domain-containing protein [Bacteroidia bacterium]MDW8347029.1 CHAT domain-containing protein [Bacteroidia bacterium]